MCWPSGKADRRYAGITHIDVRSTDRFVDRPDQRHAGRIWRVDQRARVLSNPLLADLTEREKTLSHMRKIIVATQRLGLNQFNTFVGRDQTRDD